MSHLNYDMDGNEIKLYERPNPYAEFIARHRQFILLLANDLLKSPTLETALMTRPHPR